MIDLLPRRPRARRDRPSRAAARDGRRRHLADRAATRGQAANVAAWIAALGGSSRFVGKRGADDAGMHSRHRGCATSVSTCSARSSRPGTASSSRSSIRPASARCAPTAASPSSSVPRRSKRRGSRSCTHLHVSGYALLREPVRFAAIRAIECARAARRPGQHRPLVVERDSRLRRRAVPRSARRACARRRLRERGGGSDRRRPDRRRCTWISSVAPAGARSTATSVPPSPSSRSSTRPVPATPSRPAGWSAGRSSPSGRGARCVQLAGSMPGRRPNVSLGSTGCAT